MRQPSLQQTVILLGGGLDMETSPLRMDAGRVLACQNFEGSATGGYSRMAGYERFDGRRAPTTGSTLDPFFDEPEALRAAITQVPGVGPVRGVVIYQNAVFAFRDQEDGTGGLFKSSVNGWLLMATPTLSAGGRYRFIRYTFQALEGSEVLVGVSGTNKPFVFDGATYTEITVPGEIFFPTHCAVVNNYLLLGYANGMVYYSVVGEPANFDPVQGAGGFGVGDRVTGLAPLKGGNLLVMMESRTAILYGTGPDDWSNRDLRTYDDISGPRSDSYVNYGASYFMDDRGITELTNSDNYGDYASGLLSQSVGRYLKPRTDKVIGALICRDKRQVRWFFSPLSDGHYTDVLTLKFGVQGPEGFTTQRLPHGVTCMIGGPLIVNGDEEEALFVGTNTGYVMRLERGASFDGGPIESYLRLPYWHLGAPNQRKHVRRVLFNVEALGTAALTVRPYFNYAGPESAPHAVRDMPVAGSSSLWDLSHWNESQFNQFLWSSSPVQDGRADVCGTGKNIALFIYHKSNDTPGFTLYEAIVQYTTRGTYR